MVDRRGVDGAEGSSTQGKMGEDGREVKARGGQRSRQQRVGNRQLALLGEVRPAWGYEGEEDESQARIG